MLGMQILDGRNDLNKACCSFTLTVMFLTCKKVVSRKLCAIHNEICSAHLIGKALKELPSKKTLHHHVDALVRTVNSKQRATVGVLQLGHDGYFPFCMK